MYTSTVTVILFSRFYNHIYVTTKGNMNMSVLILVIYLVLNIAYKTSIILYNYTFNTTSITKTKK